MIINRSGLTIRTAADQIRVAGRATQGVRVINLREGDSIASVTAVPKTEEEDMLESIAVEGAEATTATTEASAEATTENANE
jgi:DNA gyrase subunit A